MQTAFNAVHPADHRPLRLRLRTACTTGGGTVGYGSQFNDDDFFRDAGQVGYNLVVGSAVTHELHFGYQIYLDAEDLTRSSNGWGEISVPGGRLS